MKNFTVLFVSNNGCPDSNSETTFVKIAPLGNIEGIYFNAIEFDWDVKLDPLVKLWRNSIVIPAAKLYSKSKKDSYSETYKKDITTGKQIDPYYEKAKKIFRVSHPTWDQRNHVKWLEMPMQYQMGKETLVFPFNRVSEGKDFWAPEQWQKDIVKGLGVPSNLIGVNYANVESRDLALSSDKEFERFRIKTSYETLNHLFDGVDFANGESRIFRDEADISDDKLGKINKLRQFYGFDDLPTTSDDKLQLVNNLRRYHTTFELVDKSKKLTSERLKEIRKEIAFFCTTQKSEFYPGTDKSLIARGERFNQSINNIAVKNACNILGYDYEEIFPIGIKAMDLPIGIYSKSCPTCKAKLVVNNWGEQCIRTHTSHCSYVIIKDTIIHDSFIQAPKESNYHLKTRRLYSGISNSELENHITQTVSAASELRRRINKVKSESTLHHTGPKNPTTDIKDFQQDAIDKVITTWSSK